MNITEEQIFEIKQMMDNLSLNQSKLAMTVYKETQHILSQSTVSRVLNGEAKPSMIAFVHYVLTNLEKVRLAELTANQYPELLSKFVVEHDSESESHTYIVKADSPEEAVTKLRAMGVNVDGAHNTSNYDCSGQWCSNGVNGGNVEPIKALGAFSVTTHWYLDV